MIRNGSPFSLTPWVRALLIANAVVYLLTITVFTGPWFVDLFAFQPQAILSRWWTPFTYMFIHGSFLHLAFNLLMLFFFGPAVEERMGSRAFGLYYLTCGLGGAVFSFGILLTTPVAMVVGASAAIFGVALAFAVHWPDAPIYVFPLPMPVKAKWLVIFLATVNLFAAITGARDGVAHLAHLGGFLFGFIYLKGEATIVRRARAMVPRPRPASVVPQIRGREAREASPTTPTGRRSRRSTYDELDRVLDKISATGLESLSTGERRLLDEMSRHMRDH